MIAIEADAGLLGEERYEGKLMAIGDPGWMMQEDDPGVTTLVDD